MDKSGYLVSLRDGFLAIRQGATFYVITYRPHRLNRQFGFCQGILGVFLEDPHTREVSCENTILYWKLLLFLGTTSRGILPYRSLILIQHISLDYKIWWSTVTINDLCSNASILQKSMKANSSKQDRDAEAGSSKNAKRKK